MSFKIDKSLTIQNKRPKYDIYAKDYTNQFYETPDNSSTSTENIQRQQRIKITSETNKVRAKGLVHSTPLSANPLRSATLHFPSVTSISKPSSSSKASVEYIISHSSRKNLRKKTYVSNESCSTGKECRLFKRKSDSSRFSNAINVEPPSSSSNRSKQRSWQSSRSSSPTIKTSSARGSKFTLNSTRSYRTPSSVKSGGSDFFSDVSSSSIVAIVEGRGQARREIGIAAIDLNRPILTLVQFSDTHTYIRTMTKLSVLHPIEILFATTAEGERLMKVVQESMSNLCITTVQRKYFNEAKGLATIKQLAVPQCANLERQFASKYYCLSAAAALIRYVEEIQNISYAPKSLVIELLTSDLTLMIDHWSSKKLELVRNLGLSEGWEKSLFGVIRHTCTNSGTRMLRSSILQPFADLNIIETRLSAVEYLTRHPQLFYTLKTLLQRFPDLDWILAMCIQRHKDDTEVRCEQRLNYIIGLKSVLDLLQPLKGALEEADSPVFSSVKKSINGSEVQDLLIILQKIIHEDIRLVKSAATMKSQRCFAIRSNINGLLDVSRKIYSEIVEDISTQVNDLAETYEVPARVGHSSSKGFHILIPLMPKAPKPELPNCFIQVNHGRGAITCTTEEIYLLDQRSQEAVREILSMSNVIILELIEEVRERVGTLYAIAEAIAALDMVVGLAHAASLGNWVRPEFSNNIVIRGGRHPILDLLSPKPPTSNDTVLNEENRAIILSGANMSGKSTYLRQVALIQVLAQIGSFVPAESATLKIMNQLFTLLGCEDSPENKASTFQVQINEISVALEMSNNRTLVILDELCQGTNVQEGKSLAWAILEMFILTKPFFILATHIFTLTHLANIYPQIANYFMESELQENGRLTVSYRIRNGITCAIPYGLALAESTPLPKSLLENAKLIASKTRKTSLQPNTSLEIFKPYDDAMYNLAHRLLAFVASNLQIISIKKRDNEIGLNVPSENDEQWKNQLKNMLLDFVEQQNCNPAE